MTDPHTPTTPIFDAVAELLADCPPAGAIDPQREPELWDVALPTLGNGNGEEQP